MTLYFANLVSVPMFQAGPLRVHHLAPRYAQILPRTRRLSCGCQDQMLAKPQADVPLASPPFAGFALLRLLEMPHPPVHGRMNFNLSESLSRPLTQTTWNDDRKALKRP